MGTVLLQISQIKPLHLMENHTPDHLYLTENTFSSLGFLQAQSSWSPGLEVLLCCDRPAGSAPLSRYCCHLFVEVHVWRCMQSGTSSRVKSLWPTPHRNILPTAGLAHSPPTRRVRDTPGTIAQSFSLAVPGDSFHLPSTWLGMADFSTFKMS